MWVGEAHSRFGGWPKVPPKCPIIGHLVKAQADMSERRARASGRASQVTPTWARAAAAISFDSHPSGRGAGALEGPALAKDRLDPALRDMEADDRLVFKRERLDGRMQAGRLGDLVGPVPERGLGRLRPGREAFIVHADQNGPARSIGESADGLHGLTTEGLLEFDRLRLSLAEQREDAALAIHPRRYEPGARKVPPAPMLPTAEGRTRWREGYAATHLERDPGRLSRAESPSDFRVVVEVPALRAGNLINRTQAAEAPMSLSLRSAAVSISFI